MSESRGVRRVNGSDPEAVAYRVNPSIHLQRTMRYCRPAVCPAAMAPRSCALHLDNHNDNQDCICQDRLDRTEWDRCLNLDQFKCE